MTSPIERRALKHMNGLPEMRVAMEAQLMVGMETYGHHIDDCGYTRPQMLREAAAECADLFVYLEALGDVPHHVFVSLRTAAVWLNRELKAKP